MSIRAWEFESPPRHSNRKIIPVGKQMFSQNIFRKQNDGRVAQLVRASVLQTEGQRFESSRAHEYMPG